MGSEGVVWKLVLFLLQLHLDPMDLADHPVNLALKFFVWSESCSIQNHQNLDLAHSCSCADSVVGACPPGVAGNTFCELLPPKLLSTQCKVDFQRLGVLHPGLLAGSTHRFHHFAERNCLQEHSVTVTAAASCLGAGAAAVVPEMA
jgi:hypothetical protein